MYSVLPSPESGEEAPEAPFPAAAHILRVSFPCVLRRVRGRVRRGNCSRDRHTVRRHGDSEGRKGECDDDAVGAPRDKEPSARRHVNAGDGDAGRHFKDDEFAKRRTVNDGEPPVRAANAEQCSRALNVARPATAYASEACDTAGDCKARARFRERARARVAVEKEDFRDSRAGVQAACWDRGGGGRGLSSRAREIKKLSARAHTRTTHVSFPSTSSARTIA